MGISFFLFFVVSGKFNLKFNLFKGNDILFLLEASVVLFSSFSEKTILLLVLILLIILLSFHLIVLIGLIIIFGEFIISLISFSSAFLRILIT